MPSAGQTLTGCAPKQPAVRQCSTCDQSCEAASYDNKARQSKRSFNLLRIQSAAEEANLGVLQMCMTAAFASDNSGWWSPSSVRKKPPLSLPAPSLSLSSSSSTAKGSCQAASPHASAHCVEFSLPVFSSAGHVRCARPPGHQAPHMLDMRLWRSVKDGMLSPSSQQVLCMLQLYSRDRRHSSQDTCLKWGIGPVLIKFD